MREFRRLLIEAKKLAEIDDYFHNQLVSDERFMDAGQHEANMKLDELTCKVIQAALGAGDVRTRGYRYLKSYGMWHGSAFWASVGMAMVYYFEEIDMGMIAAIDPLKNANTHFLRFSICKPEGVSFSASGPRGQA